MKKRITNKSLIQATNNSNEWFVTVVEESEHISRISNVLENKYYLQGQHNVLNRKDFSFKGKEFKTNKIVLQTVKTIVDFHNSYLLGKPVSLNGSESMVEVFNNIYRVGNYSKLDYKIIDSLYKYGDVFEYVYIENGVIKSKLINSEDSYPVYDTEGKYIGFVEYWQDVVTNISTYIVYYNDKVEKYNDEGGNINKVAEWSNVSGLPIHYTNGDNTMFEWYGRSILEDLKPILNQIEMLLSKMDDSIETLSLNPLGVVSGQRVADAIDSSIVGTILSLEDGATFNYASTSLDYNSIKLLIDNLMGQLMTIASVPSSVFGQSNVANVSEVSLKLLYQLADNKARRLQWQLLEGFNKRFEYIRKLLRSQGVVFPDSDYVSVVFNYNRPINTKENIESMKVQYDMGAISRKTVVEQSEYTINVGLEMERLAEEKEENVGEVDGVEDVDVVE